MSCSFVSACLAFSRPMKFGPSFHVLHFQSKRITIRILWTSQDFISGHLGGGQDVKGVEEVDVARVCPPRKLLKFSVEMLHFDAFS